MPERIAGGFIFAPIAAPASLGIENVAVGDRVGNAWLWSACGECDGDFPVNIFDTVLRGVTLRGSIIGTRLDLAEALAFAVAGKVHTTVTERSLHDVNQVFDDMRHGAINGRVVLNVKDVRDAA
ncbi:hypothetical protein [Pseudoclavibacter soli]|uniref:hypothetical protein n=1 Tax=Pseudoclavibacter soli TaxID=452623 RepID=UPI000481AA7B